MKKILSLVLVLVLLSVSCVSALAAEDYTLPLAENGATLSFSLMENYYSASSYADNLPVYQELEKRTGVSIKWDVIGDYDQTMKIRMASGEKLSDIIQIPDYRPDLYHYGETGKLLPLEDLIKEYAPNISKLFWEDIPELGQEVTTADGHIWGIPQNFYGLNYHAPMALVIRKDWLDKLGLEVPKTLEDFENVMRAFKEQDPNGNGIADEIPLTSVDSGLNAWNNAYGYFASAFGLTAPVTGERYWPDENGVLVDQYQTEEFKEYLTWLNKMYKEGLIDPALSHGSSDLQALHLEDRIGITAYYADDVDSWQSVCHANGHEYVEFLMLESPAKGDEKVTHIMRSLTGYCYGITTDCADPVLAIKWIDYHYANPEGQTLMMFGIEGVHYTVNENGEKTWTELVTNNPEGLGMFNVLRKDGANPTQFTNRTLEFGSMCVPEYMKKQCVTIQQNLVNPIPTLPALPEETEELTVIKADLDTYTNECFLAFIQGNMSLDNWDTFIQTMKGIGADRVLEITQIQYDRSLGK